MSTSEEISVLSHLYPEMYPIPPQQGEAKQRRRRRKKAKAEGGDAAKKRKLSQRQMNVLEMNFMDEHKLESEKKDRLATELGLDPRQVAVWFQNRRARYKTQKLEDDYSQLKAQHDTVVAQKCQLETEILKLKEQLADAEKVSQNYLQIAADRNYVVDCCVSSNSASSSISVETTTMHETDPFLGSFTMGGEDNMFYVPEHGYYSTYILHGGNGSWVNLFDG